MFYGRPYKLGLFNTAGYEKDFDRLKLLLYPKTVVFLVCFSVVNTSSYENVKEKWIPEISHHCPNTLFFLVGTKIDLRQNNNDSEIISSEQGKKLAKQLKAIEYVECSALTQIGLRRLKRSI